MTLTEEALLGALLHSPAATTTRIAHILTATDFDDPRHRIVWDGITDTAAKGNDPNPPAVDANLRNRGLVHKADQPHMVALIIDLYRDCDLPRRANDYALTVLADATRRTIHQAATRLQQAADEGSLDAVTRAATTQAEALSTAVQRLTNALGVTA